MRGKRKVIGLALVLFCVIIGHAFSANARTVRSSDKADSSKASLQQDIVLKHGDNLDRVLARAGVKPDQRQAAEASLRDSRKTRRLQIGSHILLTFRRDAERLRHLVALHIDLDKKADVTLVPRADRSFNLKNLAVAARTAIGTLAPSHLRSVAGIAGRDLTASLLETGLPAKVAQQVSEAFLFDPDFPAKPPAGSHFNILYEPVSRLSVAAAGGILHSVAITIHGREHSVYRYPFGNGLVAFVEPDGRGVLNANLTRPLPDARISSPWGWRFHPVLRRPEFHKGIDITAPMGTPVLAAADGTVSFAGQHGNNGVLVKLEHVAQLATTYSHLQRVAGNLRVGSRVSKGQLIGFVGKTGLATGPHLYYEVFVAGERVNPDKSDLAVPIRLAGTDLRRFQQYIVGESSTR